MKRFFGQAALLAALLTGFIAPAFGDQTTPSSDSVKTFALEWFKHLQAGRIDRTQMTTAFSEHLTDDAVKEMSRYLKSYGPATGDEIVQSRTIEDQTFYVVKLFLQRGDALSLLIGFDENGRLPGSRSQAWAGSSNRKGACFCAHPQCRGSNRILAAATDNALHLLILHQR